MQLFKDRADPGLCSVFGWDDLAMAAASAASSAGGSGGSGGSPSWAQLGVAPAIIGGVLNNSAVQQAKNAAERAAQDNGALYKSNLTTANSLEAPYTATGINANNQINALLGLPSTGVTPQSAQTQSNPDYAAYVRNNPDLFDQFQRQNGYARGRTMDDYGRLMWTQFDNSGRTYTPFGAAPNGYDPKNPTGATPGAVSTTDATTAAKNAFQQYLDSTGHQFRLDTGVNALQSSAAAKGLLKSGATLKGVTTYGQNVGTGDFQNYLGNLYAQQNLGPGATTNLINVGSSTAGALAGNNDSVASTDANAALTGAANNNQLLGSITNALAYARGQSSYGGSKGADAYSAFAKYGNQPG